MSQSLTDLIDYYYSRSPSKPFLAHIEYFTDHNGITSKSISKQWSHLTGENTIKTRLKGHLTIKAANQSLSAMDAKCPYREAFKTSEELMPCLKHPCDTGIVNSDGSINRESLETMMRATFEFNGDLRQWVLRKSVMDTYLKCCGERDRYHQGKAPYKISWTTVAQAEWDDFFKTFSDCKVLGESSVTAVTFLRFYFKGDELYSDTISH